MYENEIQMSISSSSIKFTYIIDFMEFQRGSSDFPMLRRSDYHSTYERLCKNLSCRIYLSHHFFTLNTQAYEPCFMHLKMFLKAIPSYDKHFSPDVRVRMTFVILFASD
jgi:hypothetical protein